MGLSGELIQVIVNLIVNAAHAIADVVKDTGTKGTIAINALQRCGFAEIRIRDAGAGIPEAARSRIFEPFFTTKPVGKGTGQGLRARSVIVEKHGGALRFDTVVGAGTTFVILLPLAS